MKKTRTTFLSIAGATPTASRSGSALSEGRSISSDAGRGPAEVRPADVLTIVFSLALFVLTALFAAKVPSAGMLMLIYASVALFQMLLIPLSRRTAVLTLIRDLVFPVVAVLVIFDSLGPLVPAVNPRDIDHLLIRADYLLFGGYPTVFLERFVTPLLTDLLQVAYTSYYFMPIALGIVLKKQGRHEAFERSLFLILLCFYLSYIGYLLFPALGPRYAMDHLHEGPLTGFLAAQPIQDLLNLLEGGKRDAFPSGHTGIALTVLVLSRRYSRPLFRALLLPALLLIAATVYCRYHYVVDVIGGVALTVVTFFIGEVYYRFRMRGRQPFPHL